ncbi:MAG: hypothetical protein H6R17_2015 [Proteobacteria bacterium]|nr:hypothetical protein [Pseudomonadota bacterium]
MRKHLQGIDHVVIAVADLDQAAADFERLGFTLTPRGRHTMGSENHCAMFAGDYFELLAVPADHPVTRYYSDFLAQGDGLAALALKTDDAAGFHAELASAGICAAPPVDFSRPVILPEGARDAAFRITQVDISETPGGLVFACQHLTRDVVWRPEYEEHANGAIGLHGISVLTDAANFGATRDAYERLFDRAAEGSGQDGRNWRVATGNTPIEVRTPAAFAEQYAGLEVGRRTLPFFGALHFCVRSLAQTRSALELSGVEFAARADGAIAVGAPLTHGLVVVFTELSA